LHRHEVTDIGRFALGASHPRQKGLILCFAVLSLFPLFEVQTRITSRGTARSIEPSAAQAHDRTAIIAPIQQLHFLSG